MITATLYDRETVVQILCDSFENNKSVNYVIKQDHKKKERLRELMNYSFDKCFLYGEILLAEDRKGCALILYPDKTKTTLKSLFLDLKLAWNCIGLTRLRRITQRKKKIGINYPAKPFLYLWFIAVSPTEQSKGIGKKLLEEIINKSILTGRPIFLETSMKENLEFYHKMGFKVYNELYFSYKLYLIKRELIN